MPNYFDDIRIDINEMHRKVNQESPRHPFNQFSLTKKILHKILYRIKLYPKLIESGFIRRWFSEFNFYWQKEIGARPLKFHDFFYLYSNYRVKFQNIKLEEEDNPNKFLQDWQKPANIYQIFSCTYQYSTNPFSYLPFKKYLKKNDNILEYGCGIAPITTSLVHYRPNKYNLTIADIPQYNYHYAKWKLKKFKVKTIDIDPTKIPPLEKYNVVFIITVLEHLTDPLEVIKNITDHIKPGGFLIFDYIMTDGEGLDTKNSLDQKKKVIEYIKENYKIIKGDLNTNKSIKASIAKKI